MTAVTLRMPQEIIDETGLEYSGLRDVTAWAVVIDGINVAASVVTLAALAPQTERLAHAIRRWRLRQPFNDCTLTVRGPGIDLRIDLPPNVSRTKILDALRRLTALGNDTSSS